MPVDQVPFGARTDRLHLPPPLNAGLRDPDPDADRAGPESGTGEATIAVSLVFPVLAILVDRRRTGRVHPAWWSGLAALVLMVLVTEAVTYSPAGTALYRAVTAGSPGAAVAPLAFPAPPGPPPA